MYRKSSGLVLAVATATGAMIGMAAGFALLFALRKIVGPLPQGISTAVVVISPVAGAVGFLWGMGILAIEVPRD